MIATAHVIIGGAVGVATQNPVAGLLAGVASHFVCDTIPHLDHPPAPRNENDELIWTPNVWAFAIIDSAVAGILTLYLWINYFGYPELTPYVVGAFGGYLPDLIDNVPFWNKYLRPLPGFKQFHAFHEWLHDQWETKFPMPKWLWLGIGSQVVAVSLALLYLF